MLSTNILASEGATEGVQWVKVILQNSQRKKTCPGVSFQYSCRLQMCNFNIKRCFPVKLMKCLRTLTV